MWLQADTGRAVWEGEGVQGVISGSYAGFPRVRMQRDLGGCKMPLKCLLGQVLTARLGSAPAGRNR